MGKLLALSLVRTLAAAVLFQPALMGKRWAAEGSAGSCRPWSGDRPITRFVLPGLRPPQKERRKGQAVAVASGASKVLKTHAICRC
jgi:hypothetical protein